MERKSYLQDAESVMNQITQGALLTVKADDQINTMTIGWATIGFVWKKEIFMVAVRDSRHTFALMEAAADFTVSIPLDKRYRDITAFCGTKSGRDFDKFKECNLAIKDAIHTQSPIVELSGTHYECRIIFKSPIDPALLDPQLEKLYPEKDYHTLYFGEILDCYNL
ncbi:MAG: flavin reductase family protein [Desulfobulbaceae bacterium]|nr:MAG: flavin reductase family protein [Desulfobulbaceae bacterium]